MARSSNPRQTLLRQIRDLRAQMDPEVMRRVQSIAVRAQFGGPDDGAAKDPNLIPIDRDAASEVVARFLAEKDDNGDFRRRLVDRLKRGSH